MKKSTFDTDLTRDTAKVGHEHGGRTVEYTPPSEYDEGFNPLDSARDQKEPLRRGK